jgi:hypothetical protein
VVHVDVRVVGLEDIAPALAVSDYDLQVAFDPLVLAPGSVDFGSGLGDGVTTSIRGDSAAANGHEVFEVSLLPYAFLRGLQGNGFTLATLSFTALQSGVTTLRFDALASQILDTIVDDSGLPANVASPDCAANCATLGAASITIASRAVPVPATLLLVLGSVLSWAAIPRRRPRAHPA